MERYKIGLMPGPVSVPEEFRRAWLNDYGSSDTEDEFYALYSENQKMIQNILHTGNDIVINLGEGMLALWAALKCTLRPGDKMLAVSSGLFSEGFADMAMSIGAEAEICAFPYDSIPTPQKVVNHIMNCKPKVVTAVHCETPSGTLTNCLAEIGNAAHKAGALFIVDFVSSAGGTPLDVDACKIDIGLWGSQKVLSITPEFAISAISQRAWEVIEKVNYSGYDAYMPWRKVPEVKYLPYTHDWHGMKALNLSLEALTREGLEASCKRHEEAAKLCRDMGKEMGLKLFPKSENFCSPTVTTFYVPEKYNWKEFDSKLREHGLIVGGNYGSLADHTFRVGHMGSQADMNLVREGMNIIREVL